MSKETVPVDQLQKQNDSTSTSQQPVPIKKTAFVHKLYAMLSDEGLSHLIWWSRREDDCVFALHPGTEFANVLTNYFKHGNVSSFVRQLHMYGFHKVFDTNNEDSTGSGASTSTGNKMSNRDDLVWEFRHSTGHFRKGDTASLGLIKRRSSNKVIPEEDLRSVSPVSNAQYYYPVQHYQITSAPMYSENIYPQHQHQQRLHHIQDSPYTAFQTSSTTPHARQSIGYPPEYIPPQHVNHPVHHISHTQQQPQQNQLQIHHSPHQPTTSSFSSPAQPTKVTQYQYLPEQPHSGEIYHVTNEIANQQRSLSVKADYLNSEIRSTVSDVLRFSDSIPKIAPVLKGTGALYQDNLSSIQQSFVTRAESYKPSPLSGEYSQQPQQEPQNSSRPQHQIQSQQQTHSSNSPSAQLRAGFRQTYSSTTLTDPFTSSSNSNKRSDSVHFWESSGKRQPSVFVDPLNASPSGSVSGSSSRSSARSSTSAMSTSNIPSYYNSYQPNQHQLHHSSGSVPNIHHQPTTIQTKRNDSLPTYLSTTSPTSQSSRQNPPRSIPDDYNNNSNNGNGHLRNSIPNINHLTSQLRPSVLEIHQSPNSIASNGANNTSVSSNSTYSTLYSANSSISSASSRNSQGSFSHIFQGELLHHHPPFQHRQSTRTSTPPPLSGLHTQQSSVSTLRDSVSSADTEKGSASKLTVSSLLASPDGSRMKRDSVEDHDANGNQVKKVKSSMDLRS